MWSLRPWPVTVTFGGELFEIPALPAVDWLAVLMNPETDLLDIFPGLLEEGDQDRCMDVILDGGYENLEQLILDVVATVSGRPWWVALRLIEVARTSWHTMGAEMLYRGVDASRLSLSGWLDVLLLLVMRNIEPKDATMFALKLEQVPEIAGEQAQEAAEPTMSRSDFMAMA